MNHLQGFKERSRAVSYTHLDVYKRQLVTTVAGLTVGIIALFAYNALVARINGVMKLLEGKTMEFMDLLNEPA